MLEDGASHPGTTAGEIAGRTGLQPAQVAALLEGPAAEGLLAVGRAGNLAGGERVNVGRSLLLRTDVPVPADEAVAAALGTTPDSAEVSEVSGMLGLRLGAGAGTRATDGWRVDAIDPATIGVTFDPAGVPAWRTSLTRL